MKKIIATLFIIFPTTVVAGNLNQPTFQGLYSGVGAGGVFSNFKTNSTTSLLFPSSAFFANGSTSNNNFNATAIGSLFAGYLYPIHHVYIGPEIYLTIGKPSYSSSHTAKATLPTESLVNSINGNLNSYEIGADLRLGVDITPTTLIYGLLGAAFNEVSINSSSTISRPLLPLSVSVNNSSTHDVIGIRIGAGLEQKILSNINLRISYVYSNYPAQSSYASSVPNAAAPFFQLGPIANSTSMKVTTQTILVSLVYQFDDHFLGK